MKDQVNGGMTDSQKDSPIYNEEIYWAPNDLGYYAPKMSGDENSVKTGVEAREIHADREEIIRKGTENAQNQRVNPNAGSLNNPYNKNKFNVREKEIRRQYGRHNYRRSEEWESLQREKAAYNRGLGQKELSSRHTKNLKEGGKGFINGFDPRSSAGRLFWAGTIFETVSNIIIEQDQRALLDAAADPEAIAKQKLGVFAKKG